MVAPADSEQLGLAALARALAAAALRPGLHEALADLAEAARVIAGADVVVVRIPAGDGRLEAVAVAGPAALAAELEGTSLAREDVPRTPLSELADAPAALRRTAARAGARSALVLPVAIDGGPASFELYRAGPFFSSGEQLAAELAAGHLALLVRAFARSDARSVEPLDRPALELAGEALAAALGETPAAAEVVRVAATVVGARVGLL